MPRPFVRADSAIASLWPGGDCWPNPAERAGWGARMPLYVRNSGASSTNRHHSMSAEVAILFPPAPAGTEPDRRQARMCRRRC